ncbi:MAG: lysophospholipid acyltransferase family protein [Candidatus Promineifilaceae bacterium]
MAELEANAQCAAMTKSGDQCMNKARPGSVYCHVHARLDEEDRIDKPEAVEEPTDSVSEEELRRQLIRELDDLMVRVREVMPDYSPPAAAIAAPSGNRAQSRPRSTFSRFLARLNEDLLDPETWQGLRYMIGYTIEYQSDLIKRRISGDYETDDWGLDWELIEALRPFLDFLYKYYWRVECLGLENVPDYERCLLVSNQSDQPPWDPILLMTTILNEHPAQRLIRNLYPPEIPTIPFVSSLMVKLGQAVDSVENGVRLLEQEELVGVFPERYPVFGRAQRDRFNLERFRSTAFVEMASKTGTPIIPVGITTSADVQAADMLRKRGSQKEPYQMLGEILPFPRRRINSLLPLPAKVSVQFGQPILLSEEDSEELSELEFYSIMADRVRDHIQQMVTVKVGQVDRDSG